jgi:hypothetical protein
MFRGMTKEGLDTVAKHAAAEPGAGLRGRAGAKSEDQQEEQEADPKRLKRKPKRRGIIRAAAASWEGEQQQQQAVEQAVAEEVAEELDPLYLIQSVMEVSSHKHTVMHAHIQHNASGCMCNCMYALARVYVCLCVRVVSE